MTAEALPERELSTDAVHLLAMVALEAEPEEKLRLAYGNLPHNLNLGEMTALAHAIEAEFSQQGIREASVARSGVYRLGRFAINVGDVATATSAADYLRHNTDSLIAKVQGRRLQRRIQKTLAGS